MMLHGGKRPGAGRPASDEPRKARTMKARDEEWEIINQAGFFVKAMPIERAKAFVYLMIRNRTMEQRDSVELIMCEIENQRSTSNWQEIRAKLRMLMQETNILLNLRNIPIDLAVTALESNQVDKITIPLSPDIETTITRSINLQKELIES